MYSVQEENTLKTLKEALPLAEAHYYEVEEKSSTIPFNLDVGLLYQYMEMGIFFLVVARTGEEEVIGYFANLITPDPITSKPISREFGIYVSPAYRDGRVFRDMAKKVEEVAIKRKCYSQVLAFKEGHDRGLAQKLGYRPTEQLYQKVFEV